MNKTTRQDKEAEVRFFNKASGKRESMKEEQEDSRMILSFVQPGLLLDVGCGEGYVSSALPPEYSIVGIDISRKSIKIAKKQLKAGLLGKQ